MDEFAMHRAAQEGDLERVKRLIEQGVSVDIRDGIFDRTPLHQAAEYGCYEIVKLLVSNHCNINPEDCYGLTPVLCAAKCRKKDIVVLLLQHGAPINCADKSLRWTLLHYASSSGWVDVVQRIVESGEADLNAATRSGGTPLMRAAENGHVDVAVLLLRGGADVHRRDAQKQTTLHRASAAGHNKVVQVLVEEVGLDLNPQDKDGDTPLHRASWWKRSEVVKQLLIAGADTNLKNNDGERALSFGIRCFGNSTLEEVRLFVQHGFFFEDYDYALILKNPVLKDVVLKDVELCTQSIANRFHRQSLPSLYSNPNFAKMLPSIEKFKLSARQMHDVENFVKCDIEANKFCNIVKARPSVLGVLCVHSLLAYQSV